MFYKNRFMEIIVTNNNNQNNSENLINLLRSAGILHQSLGSLSGILGIIFYYKNNLIVF